jgi:hypothetical protein
MFRATVCSSSGESTVSMRHLVFVTLYGWLSGMRGSLSTRFYARLVYLYVFQLDDDPVESKHVAIIETNVFYNKEWSRRLYKLNVLTYLSFEAVFDVFMWQYWVFLHSDNFQWTASSQWILFLNVTCFTSAWVAYSRVVQASNGEQCNLMNEISRVLPTTALNISPVRTKCCLRSEVFPCPTANNLQWKFMGEFFFNFLSFRRTGCK